MESREEEEDIARVAIEGLLGMEDMVRQIQVGVECWSRSRGRSRSRYNSRSRSRSRSRIRSRS